MLPAMPANHEVAPYFDRATTRSGRRVSRPACRCTSTRAPARPTSGPIRSPITIFFTELELWTKRTLHHLIVGGVFERHPELQVVWTEMWGLRWVVEELAQMTLRLRNVQSRYAGGPRSLNYSQTFGSPVVDGLSLTPLEYFRRNCSIGASMLPRHDVRYCAVLGTDRIMWGTDAPHPEGSAPHTTEALRVTLFDVPETDLRAMLGETAARALRLRPRRAGPDRGGRRSDAVESRAAADRPGPQLPGVAFATEDPLEALLA